MDDFGSYLRGAREARKLTLDAVSARTKIHRQLLEDLEANDLSHWPKPRIYRHAFLRAYAESVGLEPNQVIAEFQTACPDNPPLPSAGEAAVQSSGQPRRWPTIVVAVLFVAFGLFLTLTFDLPGKPDDRSGVQALSPPAIARGSADIRLEPAATPTTVEEPTTESDEVTPVASDIEGELVIESDPAGTSVTVNGLGRGTTPATVRYLPLGSYTIRLVRSGYASHEQHVSLTMDRPVQTIRVVLHGLSGE